MTVLILRGSTFYTVQCVSLSLLFFITTNFLYPSHQFVYLPTKVEFTNTSLPKYPLNLPLLIQQSAQECFGESIADPQLRDSFYLKNGDFQCNLPLQISHRKGLDPYKVAERLIKHMIIADQTITKFAYIRSSPKGFINISMKIEYVFNSLKYFSSNNSNSSLHIPKINDSSATILDYAGPNLVKNLHIGHIRSIFLGDSISQLMETLGYKIFRISHVGDWGLPFGKLLAYLNRTFDNFARLDIMENYINENIDSDLIEEIYKAANQEYSKNPSFKKSSHKYLKLLQHSNPYVKNIWKRLCTITRKSINETLNQLNIKALIEEGESSYEALLPKILKKLQQQNLLTTIDGKICVALPADKNSTNSQNNKDSIIALKRKDGTYLYAAMDIAAIVHRFTHYDCKRIIYIVDETQSHHLQQVFKLIRLSKLVPDDMKLIHIPVGIISSNEGQKLSSRHHSSPKLADMLKLSYSSAHKWLIEKEFEIPLELRTNFTNALAIGAIKFSDLSMNPRTPYQYSQEKLVGSKRSSISYIYYSLLRANSILSKAKHKTTLTSKTPRNVFSINRACTCKLLSSDMEYPSEDSPLTLLAKHILKLPIVLHSISQSLEIHQLTNYIFELSKYFNHFYETVPIILSSKDTENQGGSINPYGLLACKATKSALQECLKTLGIESTSIIDYNET